MKTAFLFSGQGAQKPGMGKELYDRFDSAKEVFDIGSRVLNRDIASLCFDGTQEELNLTHNTQVCMLAVDIAAGYALKELGIKADYVAGFSLGEYAALVYSDALKIEEAFRLVQVRADSMQNAVPVGEGAMAALMGVSGKKADEICSHVNTGFVTPANYNSPVQTVISGDVKGVEEAIRIAESENFTAIRLAVSAPFHCKLMKPAAERIKSELENIEIYNPKVPIYMNYCGLPIRDKNQIPDLLVKQAMCPVQWVTTLENMYRDGVNTYIECGTGKTLWGLTKKTLNDVRILRVTDEKTLQDTVEKLLA